jgi:hypothetical protein
MVFHGKAGKYALDHVGILGDYITAKREDAAGSD